MTPPSNLTKITTGIALVAQKALGTSKKTTVAGAVRAVGGVLIGLPLIELAAGTGEQIMGPVLSLILITIGLLLQATAELIGGYFTRDNDVSDDDAPAVPKARLNPDREWLRRHGLDPDKPQPPTPGGAKTDGHGSA